MFCSLCCYVLWSWKGERVTNLTQVLSVADSFFYAVKNTDLFLTDKHVTLSVNSASVLEDKFLICLSLQFSCKKVYFPSACEKCLKCYK